MRDRATLRLRRPSVAQRQARAVLEALGLECMEAHLAGGRLFSIDIALTGRRVAVEVDGPEHRGRLGGAPLCRIALRARLLAARGWRVVGVPLGGWSRMSDARRAVFVAALLQRQGGLAAEELVPRLAPKAEGGDAATVTAPRTCRRRARAWPARRTAQRAAGGGRAAAAARRRGDHDAAGRRRGTRVVAAPGPVSVQCVLLRA